MLQGVSQQPDRIRVAGQVTEQTNMLSDVSSGLSSRPGTDFVADLSSANLNMNFHNVELDSETLIIGASPGNLKIWNSSGALRTLTASTKDLSYISTDMRFYTFDGKVYCANRLKKVESLDNVEGRPFHVVLVSALGGNFTRNYKITITFSNGTTASAAYTTPHGEVTGDAAKSTSTRIIQELTNDLKALTNLPTGTTVENHGEVLLVKASSAMTVTSDDGDAGEILRVMSDSVESRKDLPKFAPHGTVVTVVGSAANEDDYYLRFVVKGETVNGEGFGKEGFWREYFKVTEPNQLDKSTLPHVITKTGNSFTFSQGDWENRRVGDKNSNPFPSFVGHAVRDIGGFSSRLVFSAGPNVVLSRSNKPFDFFRQSATVLLESDPVDEKAIKEGDFKLDWIVPFDRNLLLLSDPGDAQFLMSGGNVSPKNAALVLTTSFEMYGLARPVLTGRTLVFPFLSGSFSGLKEFFTNDGVSTNTSDTLTEVQDKYIPGVVSLMASSQNFNFILVSSSDKRESKSIWVYKYLWDGNERLQKSWSKWTFKKNVLYFFFDNSELYIVFHDGFKISLEKLDMNKPVTDGLNYHLTLDSKNSHLVSADNTVTIPNKPQQFVQGRDCPDVGETLKVSFVSKEGENWKHFFPENIKSGMHIFSGETIKRTIVPTRVIPKDFQGTADEEQEVFITSMTIFLSKSGDVSCEMVSPYRETFEFTNSEYLLDDSVEPYKTTGLYTGAFEIPWGESNLLATLRVVSDSVKPNTITNITWKGELPKRTRKV